MGAIALVSAWKKHYKFWVQFKNTWLFKVKDHHIVHLFLNMAAQQNHIWSFGEETNGWAFVFFNKFQGNSKVSPKCQ